MALKCSLHYTIYIAHSGRHISNSQYLALAIFVFLGVFFCVPRIYILHIIFVPMENKFCSNGKIICLHDKYIRSHKDFFVPTMFFHSHKYLLICNSWQLIQTYTVKIDQSASSKYTTYIMITEVKHKHTNIFHTLFACTTVLIDIPCIISLIFFILTLTLLR